jgi:tripartite-type tricarboxylate transporter receptor subunit TctC
MHRFTPTRRQALGALAALPLAVRAQGAFPNRPIKVIVPLPASGAADASVRVLTEPLHASMGQTLNVDNRPGGAYQLGMQALLSSPADGYTIMHVNTNMCAVQAAFKRFDLARLVPIALLGTTDALLIAAQNAPFKTASEMVAWAKANPGPPDQRHHGRGLGGTSGHDDHGPAPGLQLQSHPVQGRPRWRHGGGAGRGDGDASGSAAAAAGA